MHGIGSVSVQSIPFQVNFTKLQTDLTSARLRTDEKRADVPSGSGVLPVKVMFNAFRTNVAF